MNVRNTPPLLKINKQPVGNNRKVRRMGLPSNGQVNSLGVQPFMNKLAIVTEYVQTQVKSYWTKWLQSRSPYYFSLFTYMTSRVIY